MNAAKPPTEPQAGDTYALPLELSVRLPDEESLISSARYGVLPRDPTLLGEYAFTREEEIAIALSDAVAKHIAARWSLPDLDFVSVRATLGDKSAIRSGKRRTREPAPSSRVPLFIDTVRDLGSKSTLDARDYDILMSTILLRKLLLDEEKNLTDQVGGEGIRFEIAGMSSTVRYGGMGGWNIHAIQDLGDVWFSSGAAGDVRSIARRIAPGAPDASLPATTSVTRKEFLNLDAIRGPDFVFTVEEVIFYSAYVAGGIHAGFPNEKQKLMQLLDVETEHWTHGPMTRTLRGIARTTYLAMTETAELLAQRERGK